jgi:hypothetical protein
MTKYVGGSRTKHFLAMAFTVMFGVPLTLLIGASIVHFIAQVPALISSETTSANIVRGETKDVMATSQWVNRCREWLTSSRATWEQCTCFVYIDGIFGALSYSEKICPPSKVVSIKDTAEIVLALVDRNPKALDRPFQHVIIYALTEAWPCAKKPSEKTPKQSPNTKTDEGLWRWCREHPNTVATECEEASKPAKKPSWLK